MSLWSALAAALALVLPAAALAQQQPPQRPAAAQQQPYDLMVAERDVAWRINRATGEITVCRVDTVATEATARCRVVPITGEQARSDPEDDAAAGPPGTPGFSPQ